MTPQYFEINVNTKLLIEFIYKYNKLLEQWDRFSMLKDKINEALGAVTLIALCVV